MAASVTSPYQPGSRRPSRFRLGPLTSRIPGIDGLLTPCIPVRGRDIQPDNRLIVQKKSGLGSERRRSGVYLADSGDFGLDPGLGSLEVDLACIDGANDRQDDVRLRTVQLADVDGDDPAGRVHERGEGQAQGLDTESPGGIEAILLADQDGVVDRRRLEVTQHVFPKVDGDPDQGDLRPYAVFRKCIEHRYLAAAGGAPGRPEIDHLRLAVPL